jgi:tripartite-type tricarboxylate transporter receptor subunit TctC
MSFPHLRLLFLTACVAALPAVAQTSGMKSYPLRPVRVIVGYPPGGASDITARVMSQWLSERLGQPFVVDNRSGASGNIATELVANATADGYTLLLVNAGNTINASLYKNLKFDFIRDITPVGLIVRVPLVMQVNPSVPANTPRDFIAYAKTNPGKISYASAGNGTPQHVSAELFKMMAGIDMSHIPYRGSAPALTDLMGGRVQVSFDTTTASLEHIRAGKLRALAVTTAVRSEALPNTPTVAEFVPGYEASGWYGFGAPKQTAAAIVSELNKQINTALADPRIKARLADLGSVPTPMTPAEFGKLMVSDGEKWAKVVKFSGAKVD